jgi:hypothetical protein
MGSTRHVKSCPHGRRREKRGCKDCEHGCYAKKYEPCVGYLGSGCRHCGRIITSALVDRGDAVLV